MLVTIIALIACAFGAWLLFALAYHAFALLAAFGELLWLPFRVVFELVLWLFKSDNPTRPPSSFQPISESPENDEAESRYTRDWAKVSRNYKESRGWRCEDCGVYCGAQGDRRLMHVHHRDLNPQNNHLGNLDALCVVCHSTRPGTGHRRLAGAITSDGRRWAVEQLRRQQGR